MTLETLKNLMILNALLAVPMALASYPLNGTYQVSYSPACQQMGFAYPGTVSLVAADGGIQVSENQSVVYAFQVGKVSSQPPGFYNEFITQLVGSFSFAGSQFVDSEYLVDRLNPVPVYTGEIDFTLKNQLLEIDNSLAANGQTQPSPVSVCTMNKISY